MSSPHHLFPCPVKEATGVFRAQPLHDIQQVVGGVAGRDGFMLGVVLGEGCGDRAGMQGDADQLLVRPAQFDRSGFE